MNTDWLQPATTVFMGSGFRRNDSFSGSGDGR